MVLPNVHQICGWPEWDKKVEEWSIQSLYLTTQAAIGLLLSMLCFSGLHLQSGICTIGSLALRSANYTINQFSRISSLFDSLMKGAGELPQVTQSGL
jgi:hypothetical protein